MKIGRVMQRQICYSFFLIGLVLALHSAPATAGVVERVIAVLDGEPYTLSNFREYAKSQMGRDFPTGDLDRLGNEDQQVLEQFITEKLLAAEVKLAGIKVGDEDVDQYIGEIREKNKISQSELAEALKREGVTVEKYRASIRAEIEKGEIINRQVRKRVNITSEDVERYYRLNQKKYTTDDRVQLRHILLSLPEKASPGQEMAAMAKAAEIRKRAQAGEDFAKLAQSYSEGAGSSEGGDIGWVTRGSLVKEIEEIAFGKLSTGEVSQPVRTSVGVHIIKLERREGGRVPPLAEVQGKIREELFTKALDERFQKWLKSDLRRKHRVDVKLPGVVFRPEDTKESTMDSLVASRSTRIPNERSGFLSYLNPFSYLFKETPVEEDEQKPGQMAGQNVMSLFGIPLFRNESVDDAAEDLLAPAEEPKAAADRSQESGGFFSSIWKSLNPFSKNP